MSVFNSIIETIAVKMGFGGFSILTVVTIAVLWCIISTYKSSVKNTKKSYQLCTMPVWAQVMSVRHVVEKKRVKTKNGYKTRTIHHYIPTLKFDCNFETIEKECDTGNQISQKYIEGNQVKIFLDPNNYDNIRYDDEPIEVALKRNKKLFIISLCIYFFFFGFFWYAVFA